MGSVGSGLLDHGWERIKNVYFYSLLALSTHKNVKCYPTMTQALGRAPGSSWRKLAVGGEGDAPLGFEFWEVWGGV